MSARLISGKIVKGGRGINKVHRDLRLNFLLDLFMSARLISGKILKVAEVIKFIKI